VMSFSRRVSLMREPLSAPPCAGSRRMVVRLNGLGGSGAGGFGWFGAGEACAGEAAVCARQGSVASARRQITDF
jgi:hypothetical protein